MKVKELIWGEFDENVIDDDGAQIGMIMRVKNNIIGISIKHIFSNPPLYKVRFGRGTPPNRRYYFNTLEEAKAECQSQFSQFINDSVEEEDRDIVFDFISIKAQ